MDPLWKRHGLPIRQQLGRRGEQLAVRFLTSLGYLIEQTNVRLPFGELDIVAREGDTLCFVEVRSTTSEAWGGPLASITTPKRRRIIRAARWYLTRCQAPSEVRFDVVSVLWQDHAEPVVELLRGAFDADG
jgi:putative endonuclease